MGNSQSVPSTRQTGQPTQSSDVQRASDIVTNQRSEMPDVVRGESADLSQSATRKRKSLLNFSSLRKRPRIPIPTTATTATPDESDHQTAGESADSSPSRHRLWGSGLRTPRVRPTSLFVPSPSTISARRPPSAIISAPAPTSAKEKGKEREENVSSSSNTPTSIKSSRIADPPPILGSALPVAEEEMPLSEQVLLELRNLQSVSNKNEVPAPETSHNTSQKPVEELNNDVVQVDDATSTSSTHIPLVQNTSSPPTHPSDTLDSWPGGNGGQSSNENALPNNPEITVPPATEPDVCPFPSSMPTSPPLTLPEVPTNEPINPPTVRRPLPPTGTGTIVVVQGVVHTADVRSSQAMSQHSPISHRPPRPVSSTPALRNLFPSLSSRSPSQTRSTTPQAPTSTRRSRFSSLTETLRQRSRSRTPTSSHARNNRNTSAEDVLDHNIHNHSASSLGLDSPSSDSETSTTSLTETSSSVGAVVSTDDTSTMGSTFDPTVDLFSRPRDDRRITSSLNESGRNSHNSSSDDDADVELSPGSIEVLGTLLSVATAATAASLVSGTTEPLFHSGLTGSPSGNRPSEDNVLAGQPRPTRPTTNGGDRMRSAWDNLRDRFRTRRRNSESDIPAEGDDTREQMIREMARAFNLDLGGGGSAERGEAAGGGGPGTPDATAAAHPASNAEAPEGSFERFLHNLQVDLRTALAEDYAARRARGRAGRQESNATTNEASRDDPDRPLSASAEQPRSSSQSPQPQITSAIDPREPPVSSYHPQSPRSANIDLPPLSAAAEPFNSNGMREGRPQARAVTGQPGAGINWWRLYRFPPMVMASSSPNDATSASTSPTLQQTQSAQPQVPLSTTDAVRPGDTPYSAEPVGQRAEPPQQNQQQQQQQQQQQPQQQESSDGPQQVVPVIVVGLQSVPVNRAAPPDDHQFPEAEHAAETATESTRGRPWPLRAASSASRAFSRMGRRNDDFLEGQLNDSNTEPRERHTGRTYLIFVIGGYYPPNHGIVTGADDMNSFEALWELAELIGQVKPQVASKEDIEQSGLEVFKASQLSDYETTHKVASNTVERCLICLDDYEPEEDVRLLACRHAFHQKCVDKWLEQGRNNCPACRSKGVRTNDDPPIPS